MRNTETNFYIASIIFRTYIFILAKNIHQNYSFIENSSFKIIIFKHPTRPPHRTPNEIPREFSQDAMAVEKFAQNADA